MSNTYRKTPGGAAGQVEQVSITVDGDNQSSQPLPDIETSQRIVNSGTPTGILKTDGTLLFDTTSTAIAIDLPLASLGKLKIPYKDIGANASANPITISTAGSDKLVTSQINQTSVVINSDGDSGAFLSNGVDTWYLLGGYANLT